MHDNTPQTASGSLTPARYVDASNVRFVAGKPEVIGGWISPGPLSADIAMVKRIVTSCRSTAAECRE